jgi:ABC-type multidrug transport system ATPase subunit
MLVNIEFNEKVHETYATFEIEHMSDERKIKEVLAIITMISADYYLDPELEVEDMLGFIVSAKEKSKAKMTFSISEDGLELEFK